MYHHVLFSNADERRTAELEEALSPPNRINPTTGLPYSWDDGEDELAGFDDLLTG